MLLIRLLLNSRLLIVKFWGSQKLLVNFLLCVRLMPLTSIFFKGQLHHDYYKQDISLCLEFTQVMVPKIQSSQNQRVKERPH